MEEVQTLDSDQNQVASAGVNHRSNVDTSRPFSSVKEAVAVLGERILEVQTYSPKPFCFPKKETPFYLPRVDKQSSKSHSFTSPGPSDLSYDHDAELADSVKKLEAELNKTKAELKLLEERESETEVVLASLNAELHKNMSKLAKAEAAAAAAAKEATTSRSVLIRNHGDMDGGGIIMKEEERKRDLASSRLTKALSVGEKPFTFVGSKEERKGTKKKPLIPFVGSLFSRKRESSATLE